jgi:plastocyanin
METRGEGRASVHTLVTLAAVIALIATLGIGIGSAGSGNAEIRTIGDEVLIPNVMVRADLKFQPGGVRVASGGTLTLEHADMTEAPHTLTLVGSEELPSSFEDFVMELPCPSCDAAFAGHFAAGPSPIPIVDGGDGFDSLGDSVWFEHDDGPVEIEVTAPAGSTLNYLCIIHPWMQGTIEVTD